MKQTKKNPVAQALRALAKPENMARRPELAKKAAEARWAKHRAETLTK